MIEAKNIKEDYKFKFSKYFSEIQEGWEKIQQIKTENVYLNAYKKTIFEQDRMKRSLSKLYI